VRQIASQPNHQRSVDGCPHQPASSSPYVYDFGSAKRSCLKQVLLLDGKAVREFFAEAA
jgi:hypothetical protein